MTPYEKFSKEIASVKNYEKVYLFIKDKLTEVDSDDILRMQLVFAVSFMDKYFHDLSILYFGKCLDNNSIPKKEILGLQLKDVLSCIYSDDGKEILFALFKKRIMEFTFQMSNDISKISNFMGVDNIFRQIYGDNLEDNKKHLDIIVERRNQIVHEADYDCIALSKRQISSSEVSEAIIFIENFIESYNKLITF